MLHILCDLHILQFLFENMYIIFARLLTDNDKAYYCNSVIFNDKLLRLIQGNTAASNITKIER